MKKFFSLTLTLAAMLSAMAVSAQAADYSFETDGTPEYYPSSSYEDVYGSRYNYGEKNVVDYQIPKLEYGQLSTTQTGVMEKIMLPGLQGISASGSGIYGISPGGGTVEIPGFLQGGSTSTPATPAFTELIQDFLLSNGAVGNISIPAIGVKNYYLWEGETTASMKKGLGHFTSTSVWNGNVAVCGHNRGAKYVIGSIKDLDVGDKITYTTSMGTRTYLVETVTKISSSDWSYLSSTTDNRMTLLKITYADGSYVDAEGGTLSSTGLYWTDKAGKISISGISGTVVVTEVQTIPGYTIDENTRAQTVVVNPNDTQTLHFYNTPIGGVEIIKVNEDNHSERIPNTTFEIRKVDDALVDTVTTDKNGRVFVALEDGSYYAKEVTSNKSFRLDDTPHYFEIKDGKRVTLQVTNKKLSGIVIHKIDSATGEGIYGVKFVLYDANKKPIGEYTSDDRGYIYIDEIPGGLSGRFYLRELEAAPGYTLDKQYKTVYVSPGKTVEIEWENTAVTGQIQIYKYAAEYNEVTGTAAGTPLKGAVYEIVNARSGKVVDYITTDARGVAASKPLPLTRYQLREVTAPAYWQLDPTVHDVTLEYPGQIIKLSAYDKPSSLGVSITKRGNAQVMAGQSMRYDLTVANTSNVPLESFFWHDKIPYDVARPTTLTTGTYSARLNYRVLYKTNYNASYQVLASNLLTSNNYSFSLNAIPMQAGEVVTDIYFDFGKVPVGFQSTVNPTLSVMVNGNAVNGYQMVNRADVGGKYQGTWQTATASWVTIIRRLWNTPTLPKTGY